MRPSSIPKIKRVAFLLLAGLMIGCLPDDPGILVPCIAPAVIRTSPANGEANVSLSKTSSINATKVAPRVAATKIISATFNTPMNSSTLTDQTFMLRQGLNSISGTVSYSDADTTAYLTLQNALNPGVRYTCTITTGVKDLSGTAMDSNYVWTFTTLGPPAAPALISPAASATNQATGLSLIWQTSAQAATYHVQVSTSPAFTTTLFNDSTVTDTTQRIDGLALATTYYWRVSAKNAAGTSAYSMRSFTTTAVPPLPPVLISPANAATGVAINPTLIWNSSAGAASYRLQVSTNILFLTTVLDDSTIDTTQSITGLVNGAIYYWRVNAKNAAGVSAYAARSFTVIPPPVPGVNLGTIAHFGVFAGSAGITNLGTLTQINGSVGSPAAPLLVIGLHDRTTSYAETPLDQGNVRDTIFTGSAATQGSTDAQTAFNFLKALPAGPDPGAGELGGLTLTPGTYTAAAGTFQITAGNLTLDAQGDTSARFLFQSNLFTVGSLLQARSITLVNGAQAKNIYWVVGTTAGGTVIVNAAGGGTMAGTVLASAGITISAPINTAITQWNGRAIVLNGTLTMTNALINVP